MVNTFFSFDLPSCFFARKAAVWQCIFLVLTCECCLCDNSRNWRILFINTSMGNFHLPRCFHFVVKFFFSVTTLLLSHFILFFNLLCFKVSLFSLNNSIQSIVLVLCYKKVLLDLFNFLLQICNNIAMNTDR